MAMRKIPVKTKKTGKTGEDKSDTKLIIVLGSALILAFLIIVAIALTSFN